MTEIRENKVVSGREAWRGFRELVSPKWTEAFLDKIKKLTGATRFTYITTVTSVKGDPEVWEKCPEFRRALGEGNPIKLLSLPDMLDKLYPSLSNTLAPSEIGRVLQLVKASGWQPE